MAAPRTLPLTVLPMGEQRYSCHGCGDCCRDFTVQLLPGDLEKLRAQRWEERLGMPVVTQFRGTSFLRQREDGACVFLQEGGRCLIHAELGLEAKPVACQLFPFAFAPDTRHAQVTLSFACSSVRQNKGAALASHLDEVRRMAADVPGIVPTPVMLADGIEARPEEPGMLAAGLDRWLHSRDVPMAVRLDGLAWLAQQLGEARWDKVRGERFGELVGMLVDALPDELPLHAVGPPTRAQRASLRQAAFFRLEDPKIGSLRKVGRVRAVLGQFMRSRAFSRGRGTMPAMGAAWPEGVAFEAIDRTASALESPDRAAAEDLLERWLRATVLGGRAWGSGFYGWPMVRGLRALSLNAACALWLARAHAAARGRDVPTIDDVRAAVGRVDRASGRAPWLGSRPEAMRLSFLAIDDGLRRVLRTDRD